MSDVKPVIFISYSHKDEPDHPAEGEVQWLTFVRTYLQPAVKNGVFILFDDQRLTGGAGLDPEIEKKLRTCDVFLLLISAHSLASNYIVDTEIRITRERQSKGEDVHFYPLLLTPTPKIALDKLKDMVVRPKDATPLSAFPYGERIQRINDVADEIATIAAEISLRKPSLPKRPPQPEFVHITGLPETGYENLVGRETELKRLDDAWADRNINILSLIAEGGAGKSALVNEWLKTLQADSYRGADSVLGWSFYSQGTKERATSAEQFLNWAIEKLSIGIETTSAAGKGDAIAEAMMKRRILLVLDGCEPLQHGLDKQQGELKDQGLRALLRRLASTPPGQAHGMVVLTSRLSVKDITRWKGGSAPIVNLEEISGQAGAALLRDNGVWGTDSELQSAAHDFEGHPLALALLASFLKETQHGDVRRRDHIRAFFADSENPRHDHARRVMESYEKEWLIGQPVLLAIMCLVGLFDRPASGACLAALRKKPAIKALTGMIVDLDEGEWQRAVARLRDGKLLSPQDRSTPDALDAHPLVREWFSERLLNLDGDSWRAAHSRLYDHLRRTTKEGDKPSLEKLAPLYQAVPHGCRALRHQEVLDKIYRERICRKVRVPDTTSDFYAMHMLGAFGSDLEAISWFFEKPYEKPVNTLKASDQSWVLAVAAYALRPLGRFAEALSTLRMCIGMEKRDKDWINAAISASNLSETELLVGEIVAAIATAEESITYADRTDNDFHKMTTRGRNANALHASGRRDDAERVFVDAERRQRTRQPTYPLLSSIGGYFYCDLLLAKAQHAAARDRAKQALNWSTLREIPLDIALDNLMLGRAHLGLAAEQFRVQHSTAIVRDTTHAANVEINKAVEGLRHAGTGHHLPRSLLARAVFCRINGDWDGVARDLDEVEEIAEFGPMKLYLCDTALERARLAFAKIEAFAPLNAFKDNGPAKPIAPDTAEAARLKNEAAKQLGIAADYIKTCGYHRRDEDLAELEAVLHSEKKFADLPARV